jgi:hypothetical protein
MRTGKYIFVVGAPGSKWSSVARSIYYSPSIDNSDDVNRFTSEDLQVNHVGTYFDPGMEYGDWFDNLQDYSREQVVEELDRPFSGEGRRIIKSHTLAYNIPTIEQMFPDCPIVAVYRDNDSCLGWWIKAGGFDITYPNYKPYYKDIPTMVNIIEKQNKCIKDAIQFFHYVIADNRELAKLVHIEQPPHQYHLNYAAQDTKVYLI